MKKQLGTQASSVNVTFLFWNLRGKHAASLETRTPRILASLKRFANSGVQVFLFAECAIKHSLIVDALGAPSNAAFHPVPARSRRVAVFSNISNAAWSERYHDAVSDRITVHEISVAGVPPILIVGAHLDAPSSLSNAGRAEWARELAKDIRTIEGDAGHTRTVLVGDLNMNPFDPGVVETSALHAVMTKKLALSVQELGSRKGFLPFYNPMWACFGDWCDAMTAIPGVDRSPGTFFFRNTDDRSTHFWQIFDQVLVRPTLMNQLVELHVVSTDGEQSLVSKSGRPRSHSFSDHLPILFQFDLR